ncbi:MAG: ABC transporter permease [Planctomycetes bacterium]|nr:ABC transporter permease [Planctomycetota bacterium]
MRKALGAWTGFILLLLYAPILVMVAFSFNESKYLRWTGFTLDWYRRMADNRDLKSALVTTLLLAVAATAASTVLGTMAALAARRSFRGKRLYTTLVSLPVMVPDIVLAFSMLAFFRSIGLPPSLPGAIIAHTTFNLSYVALVISARLEGMDRSIELAAQDLGASPVRAFWKVTLPATLPGIVSGALLAFTLSFDDFVITYFTIGNDDTTLPVLIYSMVRFGVTPEINAISTVILAVSLVLIVGALKVSKVPVTGGGR